MGIVTYPFFSNRFKSSEVHITINISHIALIFLLENLQNSAGQNFFNSLIDILFFAVLLTIFNNYPFYPIISFLSFAFEITETLSWFYVKSGITFQVLSALEFVYGLNAMPDNMLRLAYWSILIFGFSSLQFLKLNYRLTLYEYNVLIMALFVLFFPFAINKYSSLYPFRLDGLMSKKVFDKIIFSFISKKKSKIVGAKPKNLIMIEIESFETKCIGKFNKFYPKSMPFLSNISDKSLHFSKIQSQPYTTWSAAGMFVVHCSFPLIVNDVDWNVRKGENFELWKTLPCISDYLKELGYTQKAFCTGSCDIFNMKGFIMDHHFETFDMEETGIDRDSVLFNHIENDVLPEMVKSANDENKPFSLFILNSDTHPEFWVDDNFCPDLTDQNYKDTNEGSTDDESKKKKNEEEEESSDKKKKDDESENDEEKKSRKKSDNNDSEKNKKSDDDNNDSEKKSKKKEEGSDEDDSEKEKNHEDMMPPDQNNNNMNSLIAQSHPLNEPLPKIFRSFTCFDRILQKFYTKLKKMGLDASNTVFVVYGDHLTMGERSYYYGNDRTLSLIFPFLTKEFLKKNYGLDKKEIEKKSVTYYDAAPTILDLLGIQFSPPFPFGQSALSQDEGNSPSLDDFKFIYNYLTGDIKYENVRCLNSEGFCTGNEY